MPFMRFVEDVNFTAQVQSIKADDCLRDLQEELTENPLKGDLVQGTGGFRKVRMRVPGAGKSGGARVMYPHLPERPLIVLFYLFTKRQTANLSDAGKAALRKAAAEIKAHQSQIP